MKLNKPLPLGFDPLPDVSRDSQDIYETFPIWYLLVSPRPNMATVDVPSDYIGNQLGNRENAIVGVLLAQEPKRLPEKVVMDDVPWRFPGLCSGDLEVMD